MRGNSFYYQSKTLNQKKELKKLQRARSKYERKLEEIQDEIDKKEELLSNNVHCLSLIHADSDYSVIHE
jgi:hypothetical protein